MARAATLRLACLGVVLLIAAGCAGRQAELNLVPDMQRVWPLPPDPPRIAYLYQIRTPADIGVSEGFWKRFMSSIVGRRQPPTIEQPIGLYADEDGWMLVADTGLQVVHIFNLRKHSYAQAFELPKGRLASPVGVTLDRAGGRIFVSDSIHNRIFVYDTKGMYIGMFGDGLTRVSGLAWDPERKQLWAADTGNHRVVVFDEQGRQIRTLGERGKGPLEFNYPTHLAVSRDGLVYVSDSLNFRVQVMTRDGEPVAQVGRLGQVLGSFSKPKGVAVDSGGRMFVVDGIYDVVQVFDGQGNLLMYFGGSGSEPGNLWLPAGIAVAGRDIFVADTHNGRVQMFRLLDTTSAPQPGEVNAG